MELSYPLPIQPYVDAFERSSLAIVSWDLFRGNSVEGSLKVNADTRLTLPSAVASAQELRLPFREIDKIITRQVNVTLMASLLAQQLAASMAIGSTSRGMNPARGPDGGG